MLLALASAIAWRAGLIYSRWGFLTLVPVRAHYSATLRPGMERDSVEHLLRGYDQIRYYAVQLQTYRTSPSWYGVEEYMFSLWPFDRFSVYVIYASGTVRDVEYDPIYLRERRHVGKRHADSLIHFGP
jgi:hypothetical protein